MGMIKLLAAPIRGIVRFPLFQLACVVVVILLLQAADDKSAFGHLFDGLDKLVDATVRLVAGVLNVKSFTRSWLISGFMIAYVYLSFLLILALVRQLLKGIVDFAGWTNAFGLRNTIARERGIAAYRAWVPLERIRPAHIPQDKWEEAFAWPPDNKPPYPSVGRRLLRGAISYMSVVLIAAILFQVFTPLPMLSWLRQLVEMLIGYAGSALQI
jgi:hypothetical protein